MYCFIFINEINVLIIKLKKKKTELGRPYWGTESTAGRWRKKAEVAWKMRGIESSYCE